MNKKIENFFNKAMDNDVEFQKLINITQLKISGLVYATVEPVKQEIIIHLDGNVNLNITHYGEYSIISVDDKEHSLERSSLKYEILL